MPDRIAITGVGLISPLAAGAWPTFRALLDGATIAARLEGLEGDPDPVSLVCAVGGVSVARHTGVDPAAELAERAVREALIESGAGPRDVHCLLGMSKGAVHALTGAWLESVGAPPGAALPVSIPPRDAMRAVTLGPHGYVGYHLQQRLPGLRAMELHVAACASGLTALHQGRRRLLEEAPGRPDRVLVVSAEAALLPAFVHSYRRLGVLSPLTRAGYRGRPLDRRRDGFMLAEIGVAVVLERVSAIGNEQIELLDTAAASGTSGIVEATPNVAALTHVAKRMMADREIAMLHPHATGTSQYDPEELAIYGGVLAHGPPVDVYASKGALGHTLGAGGLVSLVLACLCLKAGRRPEMPWLDEPIETPGGPVRLSKASEIDARPDGCHAVFAAGFGGAVAGAVIGSRA